MKTGGVPRDDMIRTFNCGIGMVVVVAPDAEARVTQTFKDNGETVHRLGGIVKRAGQSFEVPARSLLALSRASSQG